MAAGVFPAAIWLYITVFLFWMPPYPGMRRHSTGAARTAAWHCCYPQSGESWTLPCRQKLFLISAVF